MPSATSGPPPRGGMLDAFRHRGYTIFWLGALVSSTGTWLGNLTVPYVLFQQTESAVWIGLASVAQFGPAFLFAPLGGSLADSVDRRLLLLWSQLALGVVAVLMWLQWAAGLHIPLLLIGLLTVFGMINGINNPAWQSLVNDLVPRRDLMSAVTLNSLQFNIARAVGPAIAGVLLATLGASWAFFFNAVSFAVVVVTLLFVRTHASHAVRPGGGVSRGGFRAQWRAAVVYMAGSRAMVLAVGLCCVLGVIGNPIFSLTVVFAEDVFRTDPIGLGLLTASLGVGAVLYAVVGAVTRARAASLGRTAAVAIAALGVALCAIGAAPTLAFGMVAGLAVGAAFLASFATLNTAIQLLAPDALRGRVLAARHMVFSASIAAGVLLGGILTDLWGVQATMILFGACLVAVVALLVLLPGEGFGMLDAADRGDPGGADPAPLPEPDSSP